MRRSISRSTSQELPSRFSLLLQAFIVTPLVWFTLTRLVTGLSRGRATPGLLVSTSIGLLLLQSGARRVFWWLAGSVSLLLLVVAGTPALMPLARSWPVSDPLHRCPAVVVLSSSVQPDGLPDSVEQERLLYGLQLLGRGDAEHLVITRVPRPSPSVLPYVRGLMADLRVRATIDEVGPILNTHGEAVAVAALARRKRWNEVLLVTDPIHSRRARATFLRTGLHALSQPCPDAACFEAHPVSLADRTNLFRRLLKEVVGLWVYRRRGWA